MSSSEEAERARALCPPHCAGSVHCPGCPSWSSAAHGLVAGGRSAKKGKPFTLYELPATTGFAFRSKASGRKYLDLCKAAGLLPVSGTFGGSSDCDAHRFFGAECIPMPSTWDGYVDAKMSGATGWRSIVTFATDGRYTGLLNAADAAGKAHDPSSSDMLHPVCGKMGP